jgi:hypothetical protein
MRQPVDTNGSGTNAIRNTHGLVANEAHGGMPSPTNGRLSRKCSDRAKLLASS